MELGFLTLLAPITVLVLCIVTKKSTSSLLLGVIVGCIVMYGTGFLGGFIDILYTVAMDGDTAWYVLFVSLFGVLLGIWSGTGATNALAISLEKYATTKKRTLLLTWLLGIVLFIDDFTSIAVRGTLTKIYDKNQIPRAEMSYIVDATGSPVNALIPFGAWGIFFISVYNSFDELTAVKDGRAWYIESIPYTFYIFIAIVVALLFAFGIVKPIGKMKEVESRALETGMLYSEESVALNAGEAEEIDKSKLPQLIISFLLSLITFVVTVIVNGDVIVGCLLSIAVSIFTTIIFKLASWSKIMEMSMNGVIEMLPMIVIVIASYSLREVIVSSGMPEYVISICQPILSAKILPVISFIVVAVVGFMSGLNYSPAIAIGSIVVPIGAALDVNMALLLGSILSGCLFSAHICFFGDVTVFTSGMTKIDNMEHATTQFPYGLIGAGIAVVLYAIAGFVF